MAKILNCDFTAKVRSMTASACVEIPHSVQPREVSHCHIRIDSNYRARANQRRQGRARPGVGHEEGTSRPLPHLRYYYNGHMHVQVMICLFTSTWAYGAIGMGPTEV